MRDRPSKSLVSSIARRSGRRTILPAVALVAIVSGVVSVFAQQPTFRSGTQIVSLFTTVLDGQKRLVPNLIQDDFEILDNDKVQPIVFFDNEIQPITVVVMLDTSGSMTGSIALLKSAAEQ